MRYTKTDSKSSPLIIVSLDAQEQIKLQPGSMVFHNGKVKLEGKVNGGIGKALFKKAFTGETFFMTTATGMDNGAQIGIAPAGLGDITAIEVGATQWRLQDGAYLAADNTVDYKTTTQGLSKALLGGTGGFIILETTGQGMMLVNAVGSMIQFELDGTQEYVIDNSHVVCWEQSLDYKIEAASGTFGFTTGEGVVCRFTGKGKVIMQTRAYTAPVTT